VVVQLDFVLPARPFKDGRNSSCMIEFGTIKLVEWQEWPWWMKWRLIFGFSDRSYRDAGRDNSK